LFLVCSLVLCWFWALDLSTFVMPSPTLPRLAISSVLFFCRGLCHCFGFVFLSKWLAMLAIVAASFKFRVTCSISGICERHSHRKRPHILIFQNVKTFCGHYPLSWHHLTIGRTCETHQPRSKLSEERARFVFFICVADAS
jgi:hypothetical protein